MLLDNVVVGSGLWAVVDAELLRMLVVDSIELWFVLDSGGVVVVLMVVVGPEFGAVIDAALL